MNKKEQYIIDMEERYPELTKEFKRILHEQYKLFCRKMMNYGVDNLSLGLDLSLEKNKRLALTNVTFKTLDKSNRIKNLVLNETVDLVDESVLDTFIDLSNYAVIAQIMLNDKYIKL